MWARRAVSVLLAVLALAGCGGADLPAPVPTSVTPNRGVAANTTPITILGDGFSVRTIQSSSGGAPAVDETFQAWLDDQPLQDVRRVDGQTLSATVPAGLPPGAKALRVQGPFGTSDVLPNAFTVEGSAQAAMTAAIAAAPATVGVGQAITVTLTVTNGGTSAAATVTPAAPTVTGTGTVGTPTGPDPASIATLAPGASGTFAWTYPATGPGTLAFSGAARATDGFSGTTVTASTDPGRPALATVMTGAGLIASLTPGRTPPVPAGQPFTVNVGQAFTLSLSVTNVGATEVGVVPSAIANCTTVSPVSAAIPPGPTPVVFLYSGCTSPTPGTLSLSASVSGTDANAPTQAVSSNTASASVLVQTPALVTITGLSASPSTLSAGQTFTVTLTLARTGEAAASVTGAVLTGTTCTTPPTVPVDVVGSGPSLTWSGCTAPATPQALTLGGSATWVDANTGTPLTAGPVTAAVPVVAVVAVTATSIVATPATLSAGQVFSVTLTLSKTGASSANLTAVSMDYATSCTVAPILPVNDIPATQTLVWTGCTAPATPLLLSISGFATWVDPSLPLVPHTTNVTSSTVRVLAPAALVVNFAAQPPASVRVGQAVTLTVDVQNSAPAGGEEATGMIVTPSVTSVSGKAAARCTAATPASVAIAAGSSVSFGFTCTPTKDGSLTFTATARGRAAVSGAALSAAATTAPPTTVRP